jgi:hypothetical protein
LAILAWSSDGWIEPTFDWLARFFTFPGSPLLAIRRPSQLELLAVHSRLFLPCLSLLLLTWSAWNFEARWVSAALVLGYFLRAAVWCIGGNLPIVPGDSAHYWNLANSIVRGEGPVLHYVASFFRYYPRWGMVDDWSLPLYPYYLAGAFYVAGNSVAVAKAATMLCNLCTIPALFWLAKRHCGSRVAVGSALTLAVFPPHVLYASLMLRESLTMFCAVLAIDAFLWAWQSDRTPWTALIAGVACGLMALTRNTCHAILYCMALFAMLTPIRDRWLRLVLWGAAVFAIACPWGYATYRDYGSPFYTYTNYFRYTPDWTVHFRDRGAPTLRDYLAQPLWQIIQSKCAALVQIGLHFWFIFTPILGLAYFADLRRKWLQPLGCISLLIFLAFVVGTLVNVASMDQVLDFGRYFPVALLPMIPVALQTVVSLVDRWSGAMAPIATGESTPDTPREPAAPAASVRKASLVATVLVASCLWGSYAWTHNYRWLSEPWHLQLVRYQRVGEVIRSSLPSDSIVMTLYPWDLYMYCDCRTVLLPHNLNPKRLREEVETYGVTHVVLETSMGPMLTPIVREFDLELGDDFAREGIGVYPVGSPEK